jgi:choline dehydrogenase
MGVVESFDYVVIGGGTAGSVLASRLSEDPQIRVVLLEAGAAEGPEEMSSPNAVAAAGLWGSSVDWAYSTTPQMGTDGTVHAWPRGKVLGGSSSINGMVHLRGHRSSYDAWEERGATGWNFDALLPYLQRSEQTEGRDPSVRGTDGPMRIEEGPAASPLAQALYQAALEAGYPESPDGNGAQAEGVSWTEVNVVSGKRQSAADAYLRPVMSRPNLTVITNAHVQRLLLDGVRCQGAEYAIGDDVHTVRGDRDVVLSAGAIGSPQILMLSGIGPAAHLQDVGIPVRADLPGVGGNLHDQPLTWVSYSSRNPAAVGLPPRCRVRTLW